MTGKETGTTRLRLIMMIACMAIVLVACSNGENDSDSTTGQESEAVTTATATATATMTVTATATPTPEETATATTTATPEPTPDPTPTPTVTPSPAPTKTPEPESEPEPQVVIEDLGEMLPQLRDFPGGFALIDDGSLSRAELATPYQDDPDAQLDRLDEWGFGRAYERAFQIQDYPNTFVRVYIAEFESNTGAQSSLNFNIDHIRGRVAEDGIETGFEAIDIHDIQVTIVQGTSQNEFNNEIFEVYAWAVHEEFVVQTRAFAFQDYQDEMALDVMTSILQELQSATGQGLDN